MKRIPIQRIEQDDAGLLLVTPDVRADHASLYEHVYRAALSVRWDKARSSLYVLPEAGLSPAHQFAQIRRAIEEEFGAVLVVAMTTNFVGISESIRAEILASNSDGHLNLPDSELQLSAGGTGWRATGCCSEHPVLPNLVSKHRMC